MKKINKLSQGSTRYVYDLENGTVLKIAMDSKGVQCNKSEVLTYSKAAEKLKKHLASIILYEKDYRWLVMKKYNITPPQSEAFSIELKKVVKLFRENGLTPRDILRRSGPVYNNLRLNDKNDIIIIDYGKFILR